MRVICDALCIVELKKTVNTVTNRSCSPCPFSRGAEGARYAFLNSINSFQKSIRTKHRSSWNKNISMDRELLLHHFNKIHVFLDFPLFHRMYIVVNCHSKNVCPLRPSMLLASLMEPPGGQEGLGFSSQYAESSWRALICRKKAVFAGM